MTLIELSEKIPKDVGETIARTLTLENENQKDGQNRHPDEEEFPQGGGKPCHKTEQGSGILHVSQSEKVTQNRNRLMKGKPVQHQRFGKPVQDEYQKTQKQIAKAGEDRP